MQLQGQMISEASGGGTKVLLLLLLLLLLLNCPAVELLMAGSWVLSLDCNPCVGIGGPMAGVGTAV